MFTLIASIELSQEPCGNLGSFACALTNFFTCNMHAIVELGISPTNHIKLFIGVEIFRNTLDYSVCADGAQSSMFNESICFVKKYLRVPQHLPVLRHIVICDAGRERVLEQVAKYIVELVVRKNSAINRIFEESENASVLEHLTCICKTVLLVNVLRVPCTRDAIDQVRTLHNVFLVCNS